MRFNYNTALQYLTGRAVSIWIVWPNCFLRRKSATSTEPEHLLLTCREDRGAGVERTLFKFTKDGNIHYAPHRDLDFYCVLRAAELLRLRTRAVDPTTLQAIHSYPAGQNNGWVVIPQDSHIRLCSVIPDSFYFV